VSRAACAQELPGKSDLSPRSVRHFPRQASRLKSSGRYVILAAMPGVGNVSPDEGITLHSKNVRLISTAVIQQGASALALALASALGSELCQDR